MNSASASESAQTPSASEQDHVFNDETCRALRRNGVFVGKVMAVLATLGVTFPLGYALPALAWSPLSQIALRLVGAFIPTIAVVAVMWWVNAIPSPETLHELKHELSRNFRNLRTETHNPTPIDDAPPRPELAFGLSPEGCLMVFMWPALALYAVILGAVSGTAAILAVAGGIMFGGFMFWNLRDTPTYPPEDPPHDH